ncbi:GNAT family N-acetyltransferase [Flavihumibacter solisilvae]|uniref:GNAT family acetyltransferase n=1 Tax=Flavihumibacter solisilvae TaxID=1349421 RepID=A0A0C1LKN4_9BACT|nr:GNAT family N-acetyltransferase [Flavihumibacter solisilvae]KIC95933.1 GNAT family acetyltransferase [Flavihumibacter solisilvae]
MERIEIRRVTVQDVDLLQHVSRQTFYETFSAQNTEENMKKFLEEWYATGKLTAELNDPDSEFYFAMLGDQVIGYLKLNFGQSQTELKDSRALEIERIYVLNEFQGQKVGQLFYEYALQVARDKDVDYVWLGVWEENQRAIGFYKKNGFVEFDKHIFRLGDDDQTDIMMKLQLKG